MVCACVGRSLVPRTSVLSHLPADVRIDEAIVVGLMNDVRGGEHLERQEQTGCHGGQEPPCLLAHAPESAKTEHLR